VAVLASIYQIQLRQFGVDRIATLNAHGPPHHTHGLRQALGQGGLVFSGDFGKHAFIRKYGIIALPGIGRWPQMEIGGMVGAFAVRG
jgi:hypothetical protein